MQSTETEKKVEQIPTVGRIVHYYKEGNGPFAAVITKVWSNIPDRGWLVGLCVMFPTFMYFQEYVDQNKDPRGALSPYWTWPERT